MKKGKDEVKDMSRTLIQENETCVNVYRFKPEARNSTYPSSPFSPDIAVIMGNGPSAKLLDFNRLRPAHLASVGMNAAYRHWDRIDFRPTHYICMDTVVIMSHARQIYDLIQEGRIQKFFLRDEIKERFPDLAAHPGILWFDDVRASDSPIFNTNLITTGSWAIRWMVNEGARTIACIGIDANYVEMLAEAKRLGEEKDLRLAISKTPDFNPNYFFSDYQRAGDEYNVPNSPDYQQATGKLVHIEALKQAKEDFGRLCLNVDVFDASPLSGHGVFEKKSFQELWRGLSFPVVTSFYVNAPTDELENNLSIAVNNARNPFVSVVSILLEGDKAELEKKVSFLLLKEVRLLESEKRIEFIRVDRRPDYLTLFRRGKELATRKFIIANSDMEIGMEAASSLLSDTFGAEHGLIALTRWNKTPRGLYLQSVSGSPPWSEIRCADITFKERNFLTYDTYYLDKTLPLPESLANVYIGTFGCDTAVAAVFRIEGTPVSNPCLRYRTIHKDNKLRDYSSDVGGKQMFDNGEVVKNALIGRYDQCSFIRDSLDDLPKTRIGVVTFGRPHPYGVWQMLFRTFGSTPWATKVASNPVAFRTIEINGDRIDDEAEDILFKVVSAIESYEFLDIKIRGGFFSPEHWLLMFSENPMLREVKERLYRYDWHSVILLDHANDVERRVHSDVLLVVKDVLNLSRIHSTIGDPSTPSAEVPSKRALAERETSDEMVSSGLRVPSEEARRAVELVQRTYPRILVIDSTPIGSHSATGQIKQLFFGRWPKNKLMQVCLKGKNLAVKDAESESCTSVTDCEELVETCMKFAPQIIYFRPIDSPVLFEFAMHALESIGAPIVVHMMDDWPERLRADDPALFGQLNRMLKDVFDKAHARLSICESMSSAYLTRYGHAFKALANGVDIRTLPYKEWSSETAYTADHPFTLRYMGGLAEDMTLKSVIEVAETVSEISRDYDIRFEIYTMPWYKKQALQAVAELRNVHVHDLVPHDEYPYLLATSDCLLIAYNFDQVTRRYVGLSFPNKLPEVLASGAAIMAYGPADFPAMTFLKRGGYAEVVTERADHLLKQSLIRLVTDPKRCAEIGKKARHEAGVKFAKRRVQDELFKTISSLVKAEIVDSRDQGCLDRGQFAKANEMFRAGRYEEARDLYEKLSRKRPLKIYSVNQEMANRKLAKSGS